MSHAIYQTPALILKTKNIRESNKLVYLYTQKFGLIYATMQSLREMKSKMRYHIHAHSLVDVDIISGKSIWHITGVHENISAFNIIETPWYRLVSLVSDMLVRLCTGEDQNEILWNDIYIFFQQISMNTEISIDDYEVIIMVRILYNLGYWNGDDIIFAFENPYTTVVFDYVHKNHIHYIQKINEALHDSQL